MDDEFGDDDTFDLIPDNTLKQLEQSAISSTQRPPSRGNPVVAKQPRIHTYGAPGLSRNGNASRSTWRPPQPRQQIAQPNPPPKQTAPSISGAGAPSSDYGFEEEDVIDLDEPSMVIQATTSALPTRGRSESYSRPTSRHSAKAPLDPETEAAFAAADAELGAHRPGQWAQAQHLEPRRPAGSNADVSALEARIAELEASNNQLQQSEMAAQHAAQQKAGEIAIVRANLHKSGKEYERRIALMQHLHAEESAKQKADLESGRKEREKMETNNRFLQHDLAQEAEKARGLRGTGRTRVAAASTTGTPRMDRRATTGGVLGDGFDDEEVVRMVSPSKSKDRSREHTPRVGNKRKRHAQDSPLPMPSLSFSGRVQTIREESIEQVPSEPAGSIRLHEDDRYDFMQKLLHHRPYEGAERSVELLTKLALPTKPSRTMASILVDGLSSPNLFPDSDPLPLRLAYAILKLWSLCLQERSYAPIYLLLDLLKFALALESASTLAKLIQDAVPICIRTIDLVAHPTTRASRYPAFAASDEYKKIQSDVGKHIDVDEVMDFLQRICNAASLHPEHSDRFWRSMEFTFILQMLHKAQPLSQITATLRMLATSPQNSTFGSILAVHFLDPTGGAEGAQMQAKQEKDMLDRLTSLLLEVPEVPKDEPAYTGEEIQQLMIEILAVFKALALTDHGTLLLMQHWSAIGRLVKFLEAQVHRLYSTRPSLGLERLAISDQKRSNRETTQPVYLHDLVVQTINTTVRLLYHLLRSNTNGFVELQQKLRAVRGGWHKFLVSFTRIAFSDQLVLEAGIENEVVDAAHSILDEVLSPEEGEAVMRAVETPRGTKGSSTGVEVNGNTMDTEARTLHHPEDVRMEEEPG